MTNAILVLCILFAVLGCFLSVVVVISACMRLSGDLGHEPKIYSVARGIGGVVVGTGLLAWFFYLVGDPVMEWHAAFTVTGIFVGMPLGLLGLGWLIKHACDGACGLLRTSRPRRTTSWDDRWAIKAGKCPDCDRRLDDGFCYMCGHVFDMETRQMTHKGKGAEYSLQARGGPAGRPDADSLNGGFEDREKES